MTADILPAAFGTRKKKPIKLDPTHAESLEECLVRHFHIPEEVSSREREHYPQLPLVLSLLDLAIDQDRPLSFKEGDTFDKWDRERLSRARKAIEYVVFAVLDDYLKTSNHNWYEDLFELDSTLNNEPCAISLNYDVLLDSVLFRIADRHDAKLSYCCDIQTEAYRERPANFGRLMKLHGSLNWLYCACCRRLDLAMSDGAQKAARCSLVNDLAAQNSLDEHYLIRPRMCGDCRTPMRATIITPTRTKDYRNPHIQSIWYEAERTLRRAEHVCFVGYSVPDDDLEVIDLLRRSLGHLPPSCITVVESAEEQLRLDQHPVGRRYRSIFGDQINWHVGGFEGWLNDVKQVA